MPLFDNLLKGFPGVQVRVFIRCLGDPLDLETREQDRFPGNLRPVVHQVRLFVLMPFPEIGKDAQEEATYQPRVSTGLRSTTAEPPSYRSSWPHARCTRKSHYPRDLRATVDRTSRQPKRRELVLQTDLVVAH